VCRPRPRPEEARRMGDRLGGTTTRRPLHLFWVLDVSGSMGHDGKIQALNTAIEETLPLLREDAADNPQAQVLISSLVFASTARWIGPPATPVETLRWEPVAAVPQGLSELGLGVRALLEPMRRLEEEGRGYAPVVVLVSDGQPTSLAGPRFEDALDELLALPWGRASIRAAIGIGRDADMTALARFAGDPSRPPLRADNPEQLVAMVQWVSRYASRVASVGADGRAIDPNPYLPGGGQPAMWDARSSS
jgi:uncharacterized protein YegL